MWSERDVDTDVREKRTSPVTGDWSKRSGDTGVSGIPDLSTLYTVCTVQADGRQLRGNDSHMFTQNMFRERI